MLLGGPVDQVVNVTRNRFCGLVCTGGMLNLRSSFDMCQAAIGGIEPSTHCHERLHSWIIPS